jgi:hypothetical protein
MPGNLRAIVAEVERQFPVRIVIRVPSGGIGTRYTPMTEWLDENCGIRGWSITPAGTRGIANDAIVVYMSGPIAPLHSWPDGASEAIRPASTNYGKTSHRHVVVGLIHRSR